jgi:hypothetical protein
MRPERTRSAEEAARIKGSTTADERLFNSIVHFIAKNLPNDEDRPDVYVMEDAVYTIKEFGKRFTYQTVVN